MNKLIYYTIFMVLYSSYLTIAQWSYSGVTTNRIVQTLGIDDSTIIAGTNQGLNYTTNNGTTWNYGGSGINDSDIKTLLNSPSSSYNWLVGTNGHKIYKSFEGINGWSVYPFDSIFLDGATDVNSILISSSGESYAGTDKGMYVLSGSYPAIYWARINTGLFSGIYTVIRSVKEYNGKIFIGTNSGVYEKDPNGYSWTEKNTGLTNLNVTCLAFTDNYLFAGTSGGSTEGVYVSTDQGSSWSFSKTIPMVTSITTVGPNIFVGSNGDGIWRSTNYGTNWNQINEGIVGSAYWVQSLGTNSKYIFAGTSSVGVWKRNLSEVALTDVDDDNSYPPGTFKLDQNYPNPFNPETKISWQTPVNAHQSLKVYDILGNEIATLIDEDRLAGYYEVDFDASKLSSGMYIYKLQICDFTSSKKMVLIK